MATHKDAVKRDKQADRRRQKNRHYRSRMRNQIKKLLDTISENDVTSAQEELRNAVSLIHRVASKGIIHRNQAARRIRRLNKQVKDLSASA